MRVRIDYYAMLREQAGCAHEERATEAATVRELYRELAQTRGFDLPEARLRVAVNDSLVGWDTPLREGDRVVFIPPVAGG